MQTITIKRAGARCVYSTQYRVLNEFKFQMFLSIIFTEANANITETFFLGFGELRKTAIPTTSNFILFCILFNCALAQNNNKKGSHNPLAFYNCTTLTMTFCKQLQQKQTPLPTNKIHLPHFPYECI